MFTKHSTTASAGIPEGFTLFMHKYPCGRGTCPGEGGGASFNGKGMSTPAKHERTSVRLCKKEENIRVEWRDKYSTFSFCYLALNHIQKCIVSDGIKLLFESTFLWSVGISKV